MHSLSLSLSLCSEKPLSLQILLTDGQSATNRDQQALPLSCCLVKLHPPNTDSSSDPATTTKTVPTGSPRVESRAQPSCSHFGEPPSSARSLPALREDTWDQDCLGELAPPPTPEEVEPPSQWTRTVDQLFGLAQSLPPPRSYSPSADTNNRSYLMMEEERYSRHPQAMPPIPIPPSRQAPPTQSRKWSCLPLGQLDAVDLVNLPVRSNLPPNSPSSAPLHPSYQPVRNSSPPPVQDPRVALPVERWAENVNRYYGSQKATGGGEVADEGLSELESLYQDSLLAPSMQRGSCRLKPGQSPRTETSLAEQVVLVTLFITHVCLCRGAKDATGFWTVQNSDS